LVINNSQSLSKYKFVFLLTDASGNTNHTALFVTVRSGVEASGSKFGMLSVGDNDALDREYFVDGDGVGEIFIDGTSIYDGTDFDANYQSSSITLGANGLTGIRIKNDAAWATGEHVLRVCPQDPVARVSAYEIFYVGPAVKTKTLASTGGAMDIRVFDVRGKFSNPMVYRHTGYGRDGTQYSEGVVDKSDTASWGLRIFPVSGMCVVKMTVLTYTIQTPSHGTGLRLPICSSPETLWRLAILRAMTPCWQSSRPRSLWSLIGHAMIVTCSRGIGKYRMVARRTVHRTTR